MVPSGQEDQAVFSDIAIQHRPPWCAISPFGITSSAVLLAMSLRRREESHGEENEGEGTLRPLEAGMPRSAIALRFPCRRQRANIHRLRVERYSSNAKNGVPKAGE